MPPCPCPDTHNTRLTMTLHTTTLQIFHTTLNIHRCCQNLHRKLDPKSESKNYWIYKLSVNCTVVYQFPHIVPQVMTGCCFVAFMWGTNEPLSLSQYLIPLNSGYSYTHCLCWSGRSYYFLVVNLTAKCSKCLQDEMIIRTELKRRHLRVKVRSFIPQGWNNEMSGLVMYHIFGETSWQKYNFCSQSHRDISFHFL